MRYELVTEKDHRRIVFHTDIPGVKPQIEIIEFVPQVFPMDTICEALNIALKRGFMGSETINMLSLCPGDNHG